MVADSIRKIVALQPLFPAARKETAIASQRNLGRKPVRLAMAAARPGGTGFRPIGLLTSGGNASPHSREAAYDAGSVSANVASRSDCV
jgi:hypothetical protein